MGCNRKGSGWHTKAIAQASSWLVSLAYVTARNTSQPRLSTIDIRRRFIAGQLAMKFPFLKTRRHVRFPKDEDSMVHVNNYEVPPPSRPSLGNRPASWTTVYKPRKYCGAQTGTRITLQRMGTEIQWRSSVGAEPTSTTSPIATTATTTLPRPRRSPPVAPANNRPLKLSLPLLPRAALVRIGDFLADAQLASLVATSRRLQEWLTPSLYDRLIVTVHPQLVNPADPRDFLLLQAVRNASLLATRYYLSLGANPNTVDSSCQAWSLLQNAACVEPPDRARDLVGNLIAAGADVRFVAGDGLMAVHVAAQRGAVAALVLVLREMHRLNMPVGVGSYAEAATAVHFAAGAGRLEALRLLVEVWGGDVRATDMDGETAVAWARRSSETRCVEYLTACLGPQGAGVDRGWHDESAERKHEGPGPARSCIKKQKEKRGKKMWARAVALV